MRNFAISICALLLLFCRTENKTDISKDVYFNSLTKSAADSSHQGIYQRFMNIDSIFTSDNSITDTLIDSITFTKLNFNAIYLYCFRAQIREKNYEFLRKKNPEEYKAITSIHTAHVIIFDGKEYGFNGKGRMGCGSIPESSKVSINSTLYSLYSQHKYLGKLLILDSIRLLDKI